MANPKGNPQNLKSYKPKWKSGKTQTIRVPIAIAHLVLNDARKVDENGNISLSQVIEEKDKLISQLKNQLSTDTSETDSLIDNQNNITITNESNQDLITDKELAKILGCDRSTLGRVRRKLLKGEPSKSKLIDRLSEYEPLLNGWQKNL